MRAPRPSDRLRSLDTASGRHCARPPDSPSRGHAGSKKQPFASNGLRQCPSRSPPAPRGPGPNESANAPEARCPRWTKPRRGSNWGASRALARCHSAIVRVSIAAKALASAKWRAPAFPSVPCASSPDSREKQKMLRLPIEPTTAFFRRALRWFESLGIRCQRLLTDNAKCYTPSSRNSRPSARNTACASASPGPTRPEPTARQSASSRRSSAAGPTATPIGARRSELPRYAPGSSTTISSDPIDPSASERRWIDSGKPVNNLHRSHS